MIQFLKKISCSLLKVIVLAGLSLLSSCKDNDVEPSPVEQKPACQLTSIFINSNESKFEYDVNDQLIKFIGAYNNYIKFGYKNNRVEELTYYYDNDESKVTDIDKIEYNSSGQWTRHSYFLSKDEDLAVYDETENRIEIINKANDIVYRSYIFEYSNGNLIKQSKSNYNTDGSFSFTSYYTYEYDVNKENKLASFESLIGYRYLTETRLGQEPTPSKHMLKTVKTLLSDGSTVSMSASFEYEYNDMGFPTKLTISGGDLNGDGETNSNDVLVYTYQYDCF